MKRSGLSRTIVVIAMMLIGWLPSLAHDFEVDGIFYDKFNSSEVGVTYKGYYYHSYSNEYEGDVVIPSSVNYEGITYSVTSIGNEAFSGCWDLTSIEIPNSVTWIGNYAFYHCSSLTSIQIPNSVTSIGDNAFYSCDSLTSIEIPNSVTWIDDYAFSGCDGLTSVVIGNGVTSIGYKAFYSCDSLTSVVWNAIKCSDFSSSSRPFENSPNITSFTFGDEVEYIPEYLCYNLSKLTSIEIGNSVTSIGDYAFWRCDGLTSVVWNAIKCSDFDYNYNTPFRSCPNITSFTFGDEVEHIPAYLCHNLSKLPSIEIPNSVTSIGDEAFSGCTSLASIEIPNSVTSIGNYAFCYCSSLTSIQIPNSVTSIGSFAFSECFCLTNIEIGNSVTSIGSSAFNHCESLTSIQIPNSVTSIGDYAFYYCSSLTSIEIGNSVTSIGNYAFSGCSSLTSIQIPNSVTSIGNEAFSWCSSLTSIEIPNSVTSIGDYAFRECLSLTSIEIPNCVTSIGNYAFYHCSSLTSVVIGNSVTRIGSSAFSGCSNLTKITCLATIPPTIKSNTFSNYSAELYVPSGCKAAYESAEYWKNFNNILEFSSSANFLSGKTVNTYSGATERVSVEMTNEQAITAFQCDIYLPDGISVATIDGEYDINLSSRAKSSHSLSCVEQSDGSIRLLCYSMSLATFSGNEGELFDINFNISKEIEGNYQVLIDNIVLTDKAQNEYKSSAAIIDFNVKAYVPADVNNDGSINVTDVVATASYILGLDTKKFIFEAADMTKDGKINVTDIVGIASIILNGGSASNVSSQRCAPNTSDVIKIEDFAAGKNQSQQVAIEMTNASDYSACQMDIRLPKGMSIAECELASASTDHMVAYRELLDGAVRVLVYSLTCRTLPNSEEGIIRLRTTTDSRFEGGEIVVENILFADRGQNEYRLYDSVANVNLATGVSATDMDCVVYAENRSIVIISPCDQQATISSVDGLSRTYSLNDGRNEIDAPQAGIYIVTLADKTSKVIVK